jgi:hypothetical protein
VWSSAGVEVSIPCLMLCGAGTSRVMGDQVLFCAAVDASVTLASLDGVVRTVTALCSPLYITLHLSVDVL